VLLERHGPPRGIRPTPPADRFESLARSIAFQQLSTRVAATIWGRVQDAVGPLDPESVLDTPAAVLRGAGLSQAKTDAISDLARRDAEGSLDLRAVSRWDDQEVIEHLTQVRGIGEWTAQMFLIFDLGRTDVWPSGDLGVRAGWASANGEEPMQERVFRSVGEPFAPHRSVMAWWCWREVDTTGVWP
jgi:3-methyladenine DNA glycosylase/8-oxoguanine DNA glycosylase